MGSQEGSTDSKRKALVTGAEGMLGVDVCAALAHAGFVVDPSEIGDMDITQPAQVHARLTASAPAVVFHLAAYTDVDGAESNADRCFAINAEGSRNLALACKEIGARIIYISTDYVFDGTADKPYSEHARINPQGVYAISKAKGEEHIAGIAPNHQIVRTSWLHGIHGQKVKPNFIEAILKAAETRPSLRVVNDQRGAPTFTFDLARVLVELAGIEARGVFHVTSAGDCTWFDLAREALKLAGRTGVKIEPITTREYGSKAPRPAYSVLENARLREVGLAPMPHWRDSLKEYFRRRAARA